VEFASSVPGTNGLAFDRDGNLWTGDGTTGHGRVWRIQPAGGAVCEPVSASTRCSEVFRIQPMANAAGVGRQASTLQPPQTPANPNPQPLVANGLAFNHEGNLYIADTARGAIWKAEFDRGGNLQSATGCDTTFTGNTLCLDNILVAHPYLEGTDGIALDSAGNIWNSANERNAMVAVTKAGGVSEIFRNPVNAGLRNSGPDNTRILELPTSPFLSGKRLCTANSDGNRRDNSPNTAGEIKPAGPDRGKISCLDQPLTIQGLPLPVR
jgi:sugar lactone lactonase YvrE